MNIKGKIDNYFEISKSKSTIGKEFLAAIATYLTLSYIFILNPILLSKSGIDISAAFFATIIATTFATLLMGLWAKLPFAVATAPSITTFFVSFVCLKLELSWQAALTAVIASGLLSILMTVLSIRGKLIESISAPLRIGVLMAISGFLIANGFVQGKMISYLGEFLVVSNFNWNSLISTINSNNAYVLYTGLFVTLFFRLKWFKFSAAPLLGIFAATVVATSFGIKTVSKAELSPEMFSSIGQVDLSPFLTFDSRFLIAILVFFIIDFFAGVGKYIGLFSAMGGPTENKLDESKLDKALKVDGIGNIIGGFLGASSLAVFVSSAVGIKAGGKTGLTAIFIAMLVLLSLFSIPLVGSVPIEATSGILIYVGFLLFPLKALNPKNKILNWFDRIVVIFAAFLSFVTYGLDKAIMVVFVIYTGKVIYQLISNKQRPTKSDIILILTTTLLLSAIIAQYLV